MPQSALGNLVAWQLRRPQFVPGARTLQFSSLSFDVSFQELFTTWARAARSCSSTTRRGATRCGSSTYLVRRTGSSGCSCRTSPCAASRRGRGLDRDACPQHLREVYTAGEQLQVDPVLRALFAALPDCRAGEPVRPVGVATSSRRTRSTGRRARGRCCRRIGGPIANSAGARARRAARAAAGGRARRAATSAAPASPAATSARADLTRERFLPGAVGRGAATGSTRRATSRAGCPTASSSSSAALDHQVKFRGYRIEPGEVGAVAVGLPRRRAVRRRWCATLDAGAAAHGLPRARARGQRSTSRRVHRFAQGAACRRTWCPATTSWCRTPPADHQRQGRHAGAARRRVRPRRSWRARTEAPSSARGAGAGRASGRTLLGVPGRRGARRLLRARRRLAAGGGDGRAVVDAAGPRDAARRAGAGARRSPVSPALLRRRRGDALWRSLVPLKSGRRADARCSSCTAGRATSRPSPGWRAPLPAEQPVYALQWDGFGRRPRAARPSRRWRAHYLARAARRCSP